MPSKIFLEIIIRDRFQNFADVDSSKYAETGINPDSSKCASADSLIT